jgi:molybdopterin synthase sulfur carrier subunit
MIITVKGYLTFRPLLGERQIEVAEGLSVRALLKQLKDEYGEDFVLSIPDGRGGHQHVPVLINGRHCNHLPHRLDTTLTDGDRVTIFPPVAGG